MLRLSVVVLVAACLFACGEETTGTPPDCLKSSSLTKDLTASVAVDNDLYTLRFKPAVGVTDSQSLVRVLAIDGAVQNSFMTGSNASLHFVPQDFTSPITVRFETRCGPRRANDLLATLTPRTTRPDGTVSAWAVKLSDAN